MDENLSWRARLAKSNINILKIDIVKDANVRYRLYYEFTYHPKPGTFKWCKTYMDTDLEEPDDIFRSLQDEVLSLRKELEA